jgi:outer membrane lipoprotein-sorting protein
MKKILIPLIIMICLVLTGCGKYGENDVVKDFSKKVDNLKAYYLEGEMQIINNEDIYKYDVKVSYKEKDLFRISLKNKANNHEQIILKNEEGVYVLTPSLNKSFKFQSEWPYNNSQVYLLQSLLNDMKDDDDREFEETDNYYVFTTEVNYPNNRRLEKQVIYLDKKLTLKEVHVLDESNNPEIKFIVKFSISMIYSLC